MDLRAAHPSPDNADSMSRASSGERAFRTILFMDQQAREEDVAEPGWFRDLYLDQIVANATKDREQYRLAGIFHRPLRDLNDIAFRQAIVRDLERAPVRTAIAAFARAMQRMRDALEAAEKHRHPLQKQARRLEAIRHYCEGVARFSANLETESPASEGLKLWQHHLAACAVSAPFQEMRTRAADVAHGLAAIRFTVLVEGLRILIDPFDDRPDYGAMIADNYARFAQKGDEAFAFRVSEQQELNQVEGRILDEVARAFAGQFSALDGLITVYGADFTDPIVTRFDREIQFFMAWLGHIAPLRKSGLAFCQPEVTPARQVHVAGGFDLALASKLHAKGEVIVPNDFHLEGTERIIVVSGPNQGGKTTFARMFGQLHHLACLGLPVPGTSARLHLFDRILTHFERPEMANSPNGKLQDELVRMRAVLDAATPNSIVVMNELFASTTFRDAMELSRKIARRLVDLDLLCVWVSFIDGLSGMSDTMVSMVSGVDPDDPARRTFRLERKPADGLAYAHAIARKYGLEREQIEKRLAS
ncbi:MAG: hypothetical protein QM688_05770 [Sphingomonas bacterium]